MSYDDNPYYKPENYGLVTVGEYEFTDPCYSFDTLVIWRSEQGLYIATDSGCSCPIPFENYSTVDELTGPLTTEQCLEEISSLKATSSEPLYDLAGWNDLIVKIRESDKPITGQFGEIFVIES